MPDTEKENMALWNAVWQTDPAYTEKVNDGQHTFTTIDAYSQFLEATRQWGPYGKAWKLCHVKLDYASVPQLCIMAAVFIFPDGEFEVENAIKHTSNDKPSQTPGGPDVKGKVDSGHLKKLRTDTITKCLSYLGFNADVFMGRFDDNQYIAERNEACKGEHRPAHAGEPSAKGGHPADSEIASATSLQKLNTLGTKVWGKDGWDKARKETVTWASEGRVTSAAQMNQTEMNAANDYLESQNQPPPQDKPATKQATPTQGAPAWNQQ